MTEPDPTDRAAIDSARNDAEFPDDERGLTGVHDRDGVTPDREGQTARDVIREDDGVPGIADDDDPTIRRAEDPQFAPEPGDRDTHQTQDFGTTAYEQSEGESLSGRLEREVPDDAPDIRPAEDPDHTVPQLEQDGVSAGADSFTDSVSDDVIAAGEAPTGGEGPEERALHVTDG
jgi:hypothetical protein